MPDEKTIAFLRGLRVGMTRAGDWAIFPTEDEFAWCAKVGGTRDVGGLDAEETTLALVTAAREWATWQGVIEAAKKCAAARRAMHAAPKHARFAREVDLMRVKMDLDAEIAAVEESSTHE